MKKNGFVSTTLIYTFFILFLLLMLYLLNSYSRNRLLLEQYKNEIKEAMYELSSADININFMVWNDESEDYELAEGVSNIGYEFEREFSYCKNGSVIEYNNNNVSVTAEQRDLCYVYFKRLTSDITIRIYKKESATANRVEVTEIPDRSYNLSNSTCTKGSISFDAFTREILVRSTEPTVCEVEFTHSSSGVTADIILKIYTKESVDSERVRVDSVPNSSYTLTNSSCTKGTIEFNSTTRKFLVKAPGTTVCEAEFTLNGG